MWQYVDENEQPDEEIEDNIVNNDDYMRNVGEIRCQQIAEYIF
jgi:hypothetical protein